MLSSSIHWQSWEEFNHYYMAFRLSLFAKLGFTTLPLSIFLKGAMINIPKDIIMYIPDVDAIKTEVIHQRYPEFSNAQYSCGTCVLNGPSAKFDAFVYVATSSSEDETKTLLVAQQMKYAQKDSINPQIITNKTINEEYLKVNTVLANHIPNTNFILLVLGCCDGDFDVEKFPSKCAVVAQNQCRQFYGELYSEYLFYRK